MTVAKKRSPKAASTKVAAVAEMVPELTDEEFSDLLTTPDDTGYRPVNEDGTINPVQIGKGGRTPNQLVTIFSLDGVDYQVPEKPSPALLLKFMRETRSKKVGTRLAVENLFISLLGEDALDALANSVEVTEEDVANVFRIIAQIAFDAIRRMNGAADPS